MPSYHEVKCRVPDDQTTTHFEEKSVHNDRKSGWNDRERNAQEKSGGIRGTSSTRPVRSNYYSKPSQAQDKIELKKLDFFLLPGFLSKCGPLATKCPRIKAWIQQIRIA